MITGKIKLYAVAVLVPLLALAVWQWRAEIQRAAMHAVGYAQLEQTIREMEARAESDRAAAAARDALARELREGLEQLQRASEAREEQIRELLERDAEYRAWARTRLPAALTGGVHLVDPPTSGADR